MSYELADLCIGIDKESLRSKREVPIVPTKDLFVALCAHIVGLNEEGKTMMEDPVGWLKVLYGKDIYEGQIQGIKKELEKRGIRWVYTPVTDTPHCYIEESTHVEWG